MKHRPQSHMQQPRLGQGGFTLVEMAIVLLIAGLLVAGISQMMSASQKNRSDQAVANEVRTLTNALERMLVDQQRPLTSSVGTSSTLADNTTTTVVTGCGNGSILGCLQTYLPDNFNLAPYTIGVAGSTVNSRPTFRALIIRTPDNVLDDGRLSRIASLIGTQGGMISNAGTAGSVTGVLGSWSVPLSTSYGVPLASAALGDIAALTNTVDAQISVNTLSRIGAAGTGVWSEANTMRNDLFMGSAGNANNGGVSDAWAIHNASGIGYVLTNAYSTEACGPTIAVNYYSTSSGPPGGAALGTFNPDNYMIVTGYTDNTYATPALLQCSGTTNQWQQVGGGGSTTKVTKTITVCNNGGLPSGKSYGNSSMSCDWPNHTGNFPGDHGFGGNQSIEIYPVYLADLGITVSSGADYDVDCYGLTTTGNTAYLCNQGYGNWLSQNSGSQITQSPSNGGGSCFQYVQKTKSYFMVVIQNIYTNRFNDPTMTVTCDIRSQN